MTDRPAPEIASDPAIRPVFLLGIRHRSGTNMLQDVLTKHPQCTSHFDPEDFLISGLNHLDRYVESVHRRRRSKRFRADLRRATRRQLGLAIAQHVTENYVENQADVSCVVAKTPSVEGLARLREFLPDAHVILLVRDGRSIIESAMTSFGAKFEDACRRFAVAANTVNEFRQVDENPGKTFFVRFEDYLTNKRETIEAILTFLGLDSSQFPYEEIDDMPVRGSSELKVQGEASIHWSPVDVDASFDPRNRFSNWTPGMHDRFNWISGTQLESLGYVISDSSTWRSAFANRLRDIVYFTRPTRIARRVLRMKRGGTG